MDAYECAGGAGVGSGACAGAFDVASGAAHFPSMGAGMLDLRQRSAKEIPNAHSEPQPHLADAGSRPIYYLSSEPPWQGGAEYPGSRSASAIPASQRSQIRGEVGKARAPRQCRCPAPKEVTTKTSSWPCPSQTACHKQLHTSCSGSLKPRGDS